MYEDEWVFHNCGKCCICHDEDDLDEIGVCKDCDHRLKKQEETGRCGWCGHLVDECVCE